MEEDLGREPVEMQDDTLETLQEVKQELAEEKAEEQEQRKSLNLIGLSTAILSTLAAIAAMQGGYFSNEGMLAQIRSSDRWSEYQAKSTKQHIEAANVIMLQALQKPVPPKTTAEIAKLDRQQLDVRQLAQKFQVESEQDLAHHELFARSVAALQVGISMGAISALTRKKLFWYLGLGISEIGIGFMVAGTLPSQEQAMPSESVKADIQQH